MLNRLLLVIVFILLFDVTNMLYAQSLSLYEAIRTALNNNETILYNAEQLHLSAQAQLDITESSYRIQATSSLQTNYNYSRYLNSAVLSKTRSQTTTPNIELNYTFLTPFGSKTDIGIGYQTQMLNMNAFFCTPMFRLTIQQPLCLSGIQVGHADIVRAKKNYKTAKMSYQLRKESLIMAVIRSYFQLWQATKDVEQNLRDVKSAKRILQIAELKLKSGQISEFEVMNTRVQSQISEDNLKLSQNNVQTQKRNFLRLLGIDLNQEVTLVDDVKIDTTLLDLEKAIQLAKQNRLEIKQAEISLELSRINLQQSRSLQYPTLLLSSTYSLHSQYEVPFQTAFMEYPSREWQIQASISFPILDGGSRNNQIQIAQYSYNMQRKNLELLCEDISMEIEDSYRSLILHQNRLQSLFLSLQIAEESLQIAELRFQQGQISSTEIDNVRQRYMNAQQSLNSAKISYITQSAQLAKAMGILNDWVENLQK